MDQPLFTMSCECPGNRTWLDLLTQCDSVTGCQAVSMLQSSFGLQACYKSSGTAPSISALAPGSLPCTGLYVKNVANVSVTSILVGSGSSNTTNSYGLQTGIQVFKALALAGNGDVYWGEYPTCIIRKWTASTGMVANVAGSTCGYADGPTNAAQFGTLTGGLAWHPSGKRCCCSHLDRSCAPLNVERMSSPCVCAQAS